MSVAGNKLSGPVWRLPKNMVYFNVSDNQLDALPDFFPPTISVSSHTGARCTFCTVWLPCFSRLFSCTMRAMGSGGSKCAYCGGKLFVWHDLAACHSTLC
jgi:hypothetical protein